MFFDPAVSPKPAPFSFSPFKSLVLPRPIGWIGTVNEEGVPNLAPFSFFNAIAEDPPMLAFSPNGYHQEGGRKDTLQNITVTKEFVYNLVGFDMANQMNVTSGPVPHGEDEMVVAGLAAEPCEKVKPPRVRDAAASFECVLHDIVDLPEGRKGSPNSLVIGRVVGIHVRDDVITPEGRVDVRKIRPLARLGYMDYSVVDDFFTLDRPAGGGMEIPPPVKSAS